MSGLRPGQVRAAALHHPVRPPDRRLSRTALAALRCPHCGDDLTAGGGVVLCAAGHAFDIARQGYVALLGSRSRTDTGDSSDMVSARAEFLGGGHFAPIAAAVADQLAGRLDGSAGPVLEIGSGTGYYLRAVLDRAGGLSGIALDSSKYAARRAAADGRVVSVLADAWSALPVGTGVASAVLTIFAPRDPAEICRVLSTDGVVVAVTPSSPHLHELREWVTMLTVDDGKANRLAADFHGLLEMVGQQAVQFEMSLDRSAAAALIRMGPNARHVTPAALALQIGRMPTEIRVTGAVTVSTFELSGRGGRDVRRPG